MDRSIKIFRQPEQILEPCRLMFKELKEEQKEEKEEEEEEKQVPIAVFLQRKERQSRNIKHCF
jgi:hypothetical protein